MDTIDGTIEIVEILPDGVVYQVPAVPHPLSIVILTPDGRTRRIEFPPYTGTIFVPDT